MNTKKIMAALLLLCVLSQIGCSYTGPIKMETGDSESYDLNVIQIIHTNPKYLTSEGVGAVRYNSALIFWRALIKD